MAVGLLYAAQAIAEKPSVDLRLAPEYGSAGAPAWGQSEYVAAAGELIPDGVAAVSVAAAEDPNLPHLFRYGTIVMITCDQDWAGFWVQDISTTTATTGAITDSGSTSGATTGANAFFGKRNVTRHVVTPVPVPFNGSYSKNEEKQVSQRTKACSTTTTGTTAEAIYGLPCDANADCLHSYDSVTCSASKTPLGSYLKIHPTAAANCFIEVEH